MCLALNARDSTRDLDAMFRPPRLVREAAARVAAKAGVPDSWLNDAVKGYLSPRGQFDRFLDLPHLKVFVASPAYLLAMKCASMRLENVEEALAIVTSYFDDEQLLPKTRLVLEELLGPG
jgi:hypothetical protein